MRFTVNLSKPPDGKKFMDAVPYRDNILHPVRGWVLLLALWFEPKEVGSEKLGKYVRRAMHQSYDSGVMIIGKSLDIHTDPRILPSDGTMYISSGNPMWKKILKRLKKELYGPYGKGIRRAARAAAVEESVLPGMKVALTRTPLPIGPSCAARIVRPPEELMNLYPAEWNGVPAGLYSSTEFHKGILVAIDMEFDGIISNPDNKKFDMKPGHPMKSFVLVQNALNEPSLTGITNQYILQNEFYWKFMKTMPGYDQKLKNVLKRAARVDYERALKYVEEVKETGLAPIRDESVVSLVCEMRRDAGKHNPDSPIEQKLYNTYLSDIAAQNADYKFGEFPWVGQLEDPLGVLKAGQVCMANGFLIVPSRAKTGWNTMPWDGGSDFDGDRLTIITDPEAHDIAESGLNPLRDKHGKVIDLEAGSPNKISKWPNGGKAKFIVNIHEVMKKDCKCPSIGQCVNVEQAMVGLKMYDPDRYTIGDIIFAARMVQARVDGNAMSEDEIDRFRDLQQGIIGKLDYYGEVAIVGRMPWFAAANKPIHREEDIERGFVIPSWANHIKSGRAIAEDTGLVIDHAGKCAQHIIGMISEHIISERPMKVEYSWKQAFESKVEEYKTALKMYANDIPAKLRVLEKLRKDIAELEGEDEVSLDDILSSYNERGFHSYNVGKHGASWYWVLDGHPYYMSVHTEKQVHSAVPLTVGRDIVLREFEKLYVK